MAKPVRAYVMYGLGGAIFSSGMNVLASQLRKIGAVVPDVYRWTQWRDIVSDIEKTPADAKIIIAGHSMGANAATWIAEATRRQISLIAAYDPTIWAEVTPLGRNVAKAINFHGVSWFSLVGHAQLSVSAGFKGELKTFNTSDRHEIIDDDNGLHAITVAEVKKLIA